MKEQTCCFSGHRNIPSDEYVQIRNKLKITITELIKKGVIYFGCGGARGFDMLAAETVLEAKETYPQIRLIMVFPCKDHTKFWDICDIEAINRIKAQSDKNIYIAESFDNSCMFKRNRHLINNSNYCICYFTRSNSGTGFTVDYAAKNGLTIINTAKI